jgi:hypothetical protein
MSIATNLAKLGLGVNTAGIIAPEKGGTGTTTGGGTSNSPTVTSITYTGDDTATNTAGGGTITINGTNFATGVNVLINNTQVSTVTRVSSTQLTFIAPANSAGSYILYVINTDGSAAINVPGLQYSGVPSWTTSAGSLGTANTSVSFSTTLAATGDAPISYSVVSGTLPSGVTLNSSTGVISGTTPSVTSSTTYNFTVRATDAQNQDTNRAFSLTVQPSVATSFTAQAVGGGGGAGNGIPGGGGGGGGVLTIADIVVTPGAAYTITVGSGGNAGFNGGNSSITGNGVNMTAIGGGRGSRVGLAASTGGSGGGGTWGGSSYNPGQSGTSGQGNSGGAGAYNSGAAQDMGGGGGGAGGSGSGASGSTAGNGGPGVSNLAGGAIVGAGGGGSASGAYGNQGQPYGPGTASTGAGGGAFSQAGGSGRVEIRYSDAFSLASATTGSPVVATSGGYRYYIWTTVGTWSITF